MAIATLSVSFLTEGVAEAAPTTVSSIGVGHTPAGIAVSPNGATVWVANSGDSTVSVISTATMTVIRTITVGSYNTDLVFAPNGSAVYVTDGASNDVRVINTSTYAVTATIAVGNRPMGIAINPAGTTVYVANMLSGSISQIDTASRAVTTLAASSFPYTIAISADGSTAYVDSYNGILSAISTATGSVIRTGGSGGLGQNIVLNSAGTIAYLGTDAYESGQGNGSPGYVSAVNLTTFAVTSILVGVGPTSVALSGTNLYVTNQSGNLSGVDTVSVIDTTTNLQTRVIQVGARPYGIVLNSAGTVAYVANAGDDTVSVVSNVATATVPAVPDVTAGAADSKADVTFRAPETGGSPITGYDYTTDGTTWKTLSYTVDSSHVVASRPTQPSILATITGLTNGVTYPLQVRANNAIGNSAGSAIDDVTPVTVPDPPTNVTAIAGQGSAEVSFTAPVNDGGTAITSYTVQSAVDGVTATCAASPCTITGLENDVEDTFFVYATNAFGISGASPESNPVTPEATAPAAPTGVAATRGDTQASVSFAASDDGGSAVTAFTATSSPGGFTVSCAASPCTVTGLTNGTSYTFTVHATTAVGDSPESAASDAVTPAAVPGRPTAVSATAGDGQASVSFTAPTDDGGSAVTAFTATSSPGGFTGSCAASPCAVTGLTNGTTYTFAVRATNAVGDSPESAASGAITPATTPDRPTAVTATARNASASVAFDSPAVNGGSAISGYTATSTPGWFTGSCASSPCTVTGLTNGTAYTFTVHATNAVGDSPESAASAAITPAAIPDSPTAVTATAGNGQAGVSFTAPTNGGSAITGFTATSTPGGFTGSCATSPCTVTGLTNGTAYTFTVDATNAFGDSAESAPSVAVTPATTPAAPTSLTAVAGVTTASVSFAAGADGGSAITGYEVSLNDGTTWGPMAPTGSPLTAPVSGLTQGGQYQLRVRAANRVGVGAPSSMLAITTLPAALAAPSATAGVSSATVRWSASADAAVTGYTVTGSPGSASCSTASISDTTCVIGAAAGVATTYTVVAHSPAGDSAASPASAPITALSPTIPATAPTTPSTTAPTTPSITGPSTGSTTLTTSRGVLSTISRGEKITLIGAGFAGDSTVTVVLYSSPRVLGTVITDHNGTFSLSVTVPVDLPPGDHSFVAFGIDPAGHSDPSRMSVTLASDVVATKTATSLPNTGARIESLLVWGVLCAGLGTAITMTARRRSAQSRRLR